MGHLVLQLKGMITDNMAYFLIRINVFEGTGIQGCEYKFKYLIYMMWRMVWLGKITAEGENGFLLFRNDCCSRRSQPLQTEKMQ